MGAALATFICAVLLLAVGLFPRGPLQAARKSEHLAHPSLAVVGEEAAANLASRVVAPED
jgi:hypothetical protein